MNNEQLQLQSEILTKAVSIWREVQELFPAVGTRPSISFIIADTNCAGRARWYRVSGVYKDSISYNLAYAHELDYTTTIAHELAHIVQFRLYPKAKQSHGKEFRLIMDLLGYPNRTYNSYSRSKATVKAAELKIPRDLLLDL